MRLSIAVAIASLSIVGISTADPAFASVKKSTQIPAQPLGTALQALARQRDFQVVCRADLVSELYTQGISGEFTPDDALAQLLSGTALTYRYLDDKTVTIVPITTGASDGVASSGRGASAALEAASPRAQRGWWQRRRLAQAAEESQSAAGETQTTPSDASADTSAPSLEEITVTGTRIQRAGYDQPTPVTVITTETLLAAAPTNFADALNQLPQFASSSTGQNCCNPGSSGNFLNLRGLGPNRVLVLLDGDRLTPTLESGAIDQNILPELLVERVDVVTGGASAAYGSDAVSGVVNYIIDNKFDGLKLVGQTGVSTYGDDEHIKLGIAAGTPFLAGRGHIVAGFEHYDSDGVRSVNDRAYARNAHFLAGNGTTVPYDVVLGARNIGATNGGVIVNEGGLPIATASNPLAGILFESPSATRNFVMGASIPGSPMTRIGGDGYVYGETTPVASLKTDKFYSRLTYELTDTLTAYARVNAAESQTFRNFVESAQRGTTPLTIFRENAYLPASVGTAMDAAGVTSFRLGRQSNDFGMVANDYETRTLDGNLGLQGALGSAWTWKTSLGHGVTKLDGKVLNNVIWDHLIAATDAVTDSSGQIVCRVTLTHPGVFPGCIPINLFGDGTPSPEALDYVTEDTPQRITNKQTVYTLSAQGDLFLLPAGIVDVAVGVEYREASIESDTSTLAIERVQNTGLRGVPTALCPANAPCRFGRLNTSTGFGFADASTDVTEGFVETLVPLLADLPAVHALEFNGAYRYTDYQSSGGVNTWKLGLSYEPIVDLRLRGTRSRDIRAPSLIELFASPVVDQSGQSFTDPVTGAFIPFHPIIRQGNPALVPEEADTSTIGIVYHPSWLPGFSGSIDYYNIEINGALSTTEARVTVFDCAAGDADACTRVIRDPTTNALQQVIVEQINLDSRSTSGIDFDLSYSRSLGAGTLNLRALFSHLLEFTEVNSGVTREFVGYTARPKWRGNLRIGYDRGDLSLFVQERFIGSTRRYVTAPGANRYVDPEYDPVFYTDVTATWRLGAEDQLELYGTVNNLFNQRAPFEATATNPGFPFPFSSGVGGSTYDIVGTYFSLGARLNF